MRARGEGEHVGAYFDAVESGGVCGACGWWVGCLHFGELRVGVLGSGGRGRRFAVRCWSLSPRDGEKGGGERQRKHAAEMVGEELVESGEEVD